MLNQLTFGLLLSQLGRVLANLTLLSLFHQFDSFFSRKMFYVETNHQHPRHTAFQFFLQGFLLVGIISVPKYSGCCQLLGFVLNDVDSPKCDDATKESGVFLWMHFILFNDTKRCLVTLAYGIDFMTAQRTMEI